MKLNLNYKEMPFLQYNQRKNLPAKPGIYYVGNSDYPVMYIGLSHNLRNRHLNHHRQSEFEEIENAVIRYRVVTEDLLNRISNLAENLRRLEKQAIKYYHPELNRKAVTTQPKLSVGAVYIQTHQVKQAGYCSHFDAEDGEELAINTSKSKLSFITRAIEAQRPIFLIASGNYKDYVNSGYHNLSELAIYKNEKIYIIISCFIPDGYEVDHSYDLSYIVYGGNSTIFIKPYVILNNQPGFQEFKKSYLTVGFINCEKSSFAQILLNLGNFQLI
ncbi:hypothetical protein H6G54_07690 [Anabaena cylindrica FACHB-243]|uniref:Excinuclease ABC C subunit domain protein n=1 Tax=Anabaena cylindrica (strain ATCC 27899 / PCC 7122) TaxID=272123 RepID=K9ZJP6_ANACC|nr:MULTISPECIES: Excinuclease ABC C subunit domain protein [Anabaena]AFZ59431.1 Excinuclease ABC C subunit domain protein [Anabaena cylindrica PCC 7122]MBD2417586.1 hypothetical protein [Anabaena cylindrica FACHB-243]MBY5283222.1 hypothetical protein [Anabaena sp. CCAP 1446/1C]MBY5307701.1 hypothetical protein [Anabaena sp. CCAP 1446/1C]MCM2405348.1 hypothetical protein [Anabaena sp. CCAP 1446/1C]